MPPAFLAFERGAASQVLRCPIGMASNEAATELQEWGGPRLPSWAAHAAAALLRAAAITFCGFPPRLDLMKAEAIGWRQEVADGHFGDAPLLRHRADA
eukprot:5378795-Pyramimonas_sp.AAC.1